MSDAQVREAFCAIEEVISSVDASTDEQKSKIKLIRELLNRDTVRNDLRVNETVNGESKLACFFKNLKSDKKKAIPHLLYTVAKVGTFVNFVYNYDEFSSDEQAYTTTGLVKEMLGWVNHTRLIIQNNKCADCVDSK